MSVDMITKKVKLLKKHMITKHENHKCKYCQENLS